MNLATHFTAQDSAFSNLDASTNALYVTCDKGNADMLTKICCSNNTHTSKHIHTLIYTHSLTACKLQ